MSILRLLFIVLLLLNLLALAATQGMFGTAEPRGEPERLTNQLQPDRIRLLGAETPPATALAPAPQPAPAPAAAPEAAPTASGEETCLRFAGLGAEVADTLVRAFDTPDIAVRRSGTESITAWWVRIPSEGTRDYAERKARELRALGITEFFIVQEPGPNQYAVSLGLFKSEASANNFLQRLRAQRVRSASIGTRTTTTYELEVRGPRALLDARLKATELPSSAQPQGCEP